MLYHSQGPTGRATSSPSAGVHAPRGLQSTPYQPLGVSQIHRTAKANTYTDPAVFLHHSVKGRRYCSSRPKPRPNSDDTDTPSPPKLRRSRAQSTSNKLDSFRSPNFFTPVSTTPIVVPRSRYSMEFPAKKSSSSPALTQSTLHDPNGYIQHISSDSDDNLGEDEMIYTSWDGPGNIKPNNLRTRIFGGSSTSVRGRDQPKTISTTPGQLCAGETETEADEPRGHLPTSRIIPSSISHDSSDTLKPLGSPVLFEFSRLLAIVPAVFGTMYNIFHVVYPPTSLPGGRKSPERADFFVSALWSILTGYQCLCLTTGLLTRWRLYYPPLPTLIRLLALQAICWPATHLTLTIFEHTKRPVAVWAIVGSTTCMSRSVQIWVTSNLWWEQRDQKSGGDGGGGRDAEGWIRWGGGKWGGRRWDWGEVGVKCVLPAGVLYFVMAWVEQFRREWSGC